MRGRRFEIDLGATVIEEDAHVRITKRGFDHRRVKRGAPDRVDVLERVAVVRGEMEVAGFVVDHPARHRDRVLEHFVGNAELFKGVDAAGREREIDRPAANDIPFPRIGPPFVQLDVVATPPEIRGEQAAGKAAPDQKKFRHPERISESGRQERRKKRGPASSNLMAPGQLLTNVSGDQLGHLKHVDLSLPVEDRFQSIVSVNLGPLFRILETVLLNVSPEFSR